MAAGVDRAYALVLQADGKILVAGWSNNGANDDVALVRYNSDGTLDTTFNGTGMLTTAVGAGADVASAVAVQTDGKIVVTGYTVGASEDLVVVRYNADGTLDTSFNGTGKVSTDIAGLNDRATGVMVQSDGKILVSGYTNNNFLVVRYNADGTLDTSFNGTGKVTTGVGGGGAGANALTVQSDGKIVVAGYGLASTTDFAVVRYNSSGALDTSFGGTGKVTVAMGTGADIATGVVIQPDGKIVIGGRANSGNWDFAVARLNSDGTLDSQFDAALTNTLNGTPTFTEGSAPVVLDADAQIFDAELTNANNFSGATLTLVRNGGANAEDVFSATATLSGGNVVVSGTTIGTYTNSGGTLAFTFNGNATQTLVNLAMQQIAYSNSSDAPPASAQINWTFNDGNTGSQGTGGALQATGSTTVTITAVNDTPTITNLSGDSLAYSEGAGAVVIEQGGNALVVDVDSANFSTGTLTISIPSGGDSAEDVLSIRNQGTGAGQIGVSGSNVSYQGVTIGTFTGGSSGSSLVITLNSSATPTAVTALVQNITYENTDTSAPTTGVRTVRYVLTDGDGGTSANYDTTVTVSGSNDAPVITPVGPNVTFVEGGSSQIIGPLMTVTDIDSSNFDTGVLTVSLSQNGTADDRLLVGNFGTGPGQVGTSGSTVTYGGVSVGTFSGGTSGSDPLIVLFNASATLAAVEEVMTSIQFQNVSDAPSTATRQVTFGLTDGDGGTATPQTKLVYVQATNDAPVNTVPGAQTVTEDTALAVSGISVTDVDGNLSTVQLGVLNGTVSVTLQGGATISAGANGSGTLTLSGSQVDINSTLATLTNQGSLNYNGSDTLTVLSTDSLGATDSDTVSITVSAVNDAPVNTVPASIAVTEDVASAITGITIADGDAGATPVQVTLSVPAGALAASSGSGVTVGGSATSLTLTGTVADINAFIAASNVSYTTASNANGSVTLTVLTSDQGNSGSGGALSDSDDVTLNITPVNDAPVATNDRLAVNLDGADDYIAVADNPTLVMTGSMTMEAWTNPDATYGTQLILNKEGEYELAIFGDGSLMFAFAEGGTWDWHDTGVDIARNVWTHVAVTYNAGVVETYVNGALANSQTMATSSIGDFDPAMNEFRIGGRMLQINATFDGQIADVRLWNIARSQAQIAAAMNTQLTGSEAGLAGYWALDDNASTTAADRTANANDGTLVNGPTWVGYRMAEDAILNVAVPGVLANDYDADGNPLTAVLVAGPNHGSLTLNANGSFSYTPNAHWHGNDSFTYKTNDGSIDSNVATVTITVTPVNDAPAVATNTGVTLAEGSSGTVITSAMLNEGDVDDSGAGLVYTVTSAVSHGTLKLNTTALGLNDSFTQGRHRCRAGDLRPRWQSDQQRQLRLLAGRRW